MSKKPIVSVLMGSDSDLEIMQETVRTLREFEIPCEVKISSAHRTPNETATFAKNAAKRGIRIIIAGAGGAAHLAGVIASHTTLPVIGVPIDTKPLKGLDSLLSIVQMPGGIPVATVAIGKAGAKNAAILSAQILGLNNPKIQKKLKNHKVRLVASVKKKNKNLKIN
jgi:phosphoribosylaminoimidazole carboxylase PurE protein